LNRQGRGSALGRHHEDRGSEFAHRHGERDQPGRNESGPAAWRVAALVYSF
jgi:hypothetical protein